MENIDHIQTFASEIKARKRPLELRNAPINPLRCPGKQGNFLRETTLGLADLNSPRSKLTRCNSLPSAPHPGPGQEKKTSTSSLMKV